MLLPLALSLLALLTPSSSLPTNIRKRDADFWSVRTRLSQSYSTIANDPPEKYFHEATVRPSLLLPPTLTDKTQFNSHYDGRFASSELSDSARRTHQIALLQAYLSSMADMGVQTWIMHGTLLGWWWNRRIMPWDTDMDVQISEASMRYLADYSNMTLWHHRGADGRTPGKEYLLEVNPNWVNASTDDWLNVIDARWIDTETGLFIDITSVRRNVVGNGIIPAELMCKDKHGYQSGEIFPLRDSVFEGVPVKIPNAYTALLEREYGSQALTQVDFAGHHFDSKSMEWIPWG